MAFASRIATVIATAEDSQVRADDVPTTSPRRTADDQPTPASARGRVELVDVGR